MNSFCLIILGIIFLTGQVQANEVSLIEEDNAVESLDNPQVNQLNVQSNDEDISEDEDQDVAYEQMNEFIQEQDQKIRDIKLLSLDLEKTNLELKKKEIEQKLSQLNKTEGAVFLDHTKPIVKLMGVFQSADKKEALLSINGETKKMAETEVFNGLVIISISHQSVVVEHSDGQKQELSIS